MRITIGSATIDLDWPRALLLALACIVALAVGVTAATSTSVFSPYNPAWDGTGDFQQAVTDNDSVESTILRETTDYADLPANETTAFVIAPATPYEDAEADRIRRFVTNGGTLVVLENFGENGNALLESIGADAQLDGRLLRDETNHFRGPAMPIAPGVTNHTRTTGVTQLTLNYATAVEPGNATVLVRTSNLSYLDAGSAELDEDDNLTAYPVATIESLGTGQVIVVGDPSITINAMYAEPDNAAFLANTYAAEDQVVFDLSHAGTLPPLARATLILRQTPALQALLGVLTIGSVAFLSRQRRWALREQDRRRLPEWAVARLPPWLAGQPAASPPIDADDRAAYLRRRHPEWDEERIQRLIVALNRTGQQRYDETHE